MARTSARVLARPQDIGRTELAQRLGQRLERRQRLLPATAEQHRNAGVEDLARKPMGEPSLADAGLARDQHDTPAAAHLDVGPGRPQALELGRPPDELGVVCAREYRGRDGHAHGRRTQRLQQRAGLVRRRDRERRAQPLGEALAGGERRGPVARERQALDQAPVGVLGERVERDLLAREPRRLARVGARRGEQLERLAEPVGVSPARLVRPVLIEPVEDRRAAGLERARGIAAPECLVEGTGVDHQVVAVERDRVAGGHDVVGRRAERPPQLAQRGAQACARRLVQDVGPEHRGEPGACVGPRVEREIREHPACAPRRGRRQLDAAGVEPQTAAETNPQHPATVLDHGTFTQAERCANGRPRRSPP